MKSFIASVSAVHEKIRWNLKYRIKLLRVRLWGRKIICSACGQPIGSVVLGYREGKIHLEWLDQYQVFVDFASLDEIHFRHVDSGKCLGITLSSRK